MKDDIRLPTDLQINLMQVQQEGLVRQVETLTALVKCHEQELTILWFLALGLVASNLIDGYLNAKEKANG